MTLVFDWGIALGIAPFVIGAVAAIVRLKMEIQALTARLDATESQIVEIKSDMSATNQEIRALHETMSQILVTLGRIEERLRFVMEDK